MASNKPGTQKSNLKFCEKNHKKSVLINSIGKPILHSFVNLFLVSGAWLLEETYVHF